MSSTHEQLSPRELYLIESYKEQAASWKHEDNLLYRFTSIILPLSIAALAVPYVEAKVPDLLATIGGLTLMTFWAISCQITHIKSNIRFSITNKIEKFWGVPGHRGFKSIREKTYGKRASYFLRSQVLRCYMFWVYLGIVVLLTLYKWFFELCPTQRNLTTDIIAPLVLVILFGILPLLAMHQAKKDVPTP
ncbi:hypothetical protein F4X33_08920 [Candidatus Poribacteria bacterium]|nr:hypothetical protein [Candidatus Poribacteria bacterium]